MFIPTQTIMRSINDQLTLKNVATEADMTRLAAFNAHIHGTPLIDAMTRQLILHHPATEPETWLYIEDTLSGDIVSALCLIPWHLELDGVSLKAGEMGIVGTLEGYRKQGLIRALDVRFKELLAEGGYDLSHIQGIPYFYRQFGYEYALPLEGGYELDLWRIHDDLGADSISFRKAALADIPMLVSYYHDVNQDLALHLVRDEALWAYLLGPAMETETSSDTWLVLENEHPVGYFRVAHHGFGTGLIISEVSRLSYRHLVALLKFTKQLAMESAKPYIRLNIPHHHELARLAQAIGARDAGTYAWQIHMPDVLRLLRKLIPVFERRLSRGCFADYTGMFAINLYRITYAFTIEQGHITSIEQSTQHHDFSIALPWNAFVQLVLGHRTISQLHEVYPDVAYDGPSSLIANELFPRLTSFFYTNY